MIDPATGAVSPWLFQSSPLWYRRRISQPGRTAPSWYWPQDCPQPQTLHRRRDPAIRARRTRTLTFGDTTVLVWPHRLAWTLQ